MFKIIRKQALNPTVTRMVIQAPLIARKALPGQFVILRAGADSERIPLTVADYDRAAGTVTIIFQVVGAGTMELNDLAEGESLHDFVGPLGTPSKLDGLKKVAVVGGGVGCAIAYPVAKQLHAQGTEVHSIVGFRSQDLVILENEFRAVSDKLIVMTDDGSYGEKGVVTAPLDLGVVFPDLGIRKDAVWYMLYPAGYLTTEDTGFPGQTRLLRRLRIPNLEIAGLYRDEIIGRFASSTDSMEGERRLNRFHEALAKGDAETLNAELGVILRDSASSFDVVSENSCHMLLMGLCFGVSGYGDPLSNKEAGYSRYDLRLEPALPGTFGAMFASPGPRPVITIEMKYVRPADGMDGKTLDDELKTKAGEALRQIAERRYDAQLPDTAQGRLRWGIAVGGRRCAAIAEWM